MQVASSSKADSTGADLRYSYSSSVHLALKELNDRPITARQLAAHILRTHTYYGSGRGGDLARELDNLGLLETDEDVRLATSWIEESAAFFRPGERITGRCVLLGLGLLDRKVREELLAGGFLAAMTSEAADGHPSAEQRLTSDARKTFMHLLAPPETLSGSTDTLSDMPARTRKEDQLGRATFAEVLAERIRRLREKDDSSPLVVHLDGPWGSGKTTVLNFLEISLAKEKPRQKKLSLVVRYNAWQQQRLDSPWWELTKLIALEGERQLRKEHAWRRAAFIRLRHFWFRTFTGRLSVLLGAFAAIAVGLLLLYGVNFNANDPNTKPITQVKDTLSIVTIVFGFVLAGIRFLTATDASAKEFLNSRPDPFGAIVRHIRDILRLLRRPVAILVDDIDRCNPDAVVRVLEGIHTVFGTLPIIFIIAGDGRWIGRAFEKTYAESAPSTFESSYTRPLGALFLEKIFQISALIPDMPKEVKLAFWRNLLRIPQEPTNTDERDATLHMRTLNSEEDILEVVGAIDPRTEPVRAQAIRDAAMIRLVQPDLIEHLSTHVLQIFEDAIEPNPRAMKRQIMAYGMARACDLASFRNTPQRLLAAWSVLYMRWPMLAAWLRENPDRISFRHSDEARDVKLSEADRALVTLMRRAELRCVVNELDANAIRRTTGQDRDTTAADAEKGLQAGAT